MNEEYEQEISIKELIFYLLYRWRAFLLAGIIGAVVLGGAAAAKTFITKVNPEDIQKAEEEYQMEMNLYETDLAATEKEISRLESLYGQQDEYMQNSVLMNLDALHKPAATATLVIQTKGNLEKILDGTSQDPADSYVKVYSAFINNSIDLTELEKLTGIEEKYLKELISADPDYESNTVDVEVCGSDLDTAELIMDEVLGQTEIHQEVVNSEVGEHDLKITNISSGYVCDNKEKEERKSLLEEQKTNNGKLDDYRTKLTTVKDVKKNLVQPSKPGILFSGTPIKKAVKFGIAGAFLGCCLIGFIYLMSFLLNACIYTGEDLIRMLNAAVLGEFSSSEKRGFIDKFIEKAEGKASKIPEEKIYQRISSNINSLEGEGKSILITGTISDKKLKEIVQNLGEKNQGVHFVSGSNILIDSDTVELMGNCDSVIIAAERGVTRTSDAYKEIQMISGYKKIIGYILL